METTNTTGNKYEGVEKRRKRAACTSSTEPLHTHTQDTQQKCVAGSIDSGSAESSSVPFLKTKITTEDKERFRKTFESLDSKKFWVLKATREAAAAAGPDVIPVSVEEKMAAFALSSNFLHPAHSLILDVDENSWADVFTKEELIEIQNEEPPLIRQTPEELDQLLKEIHGMSTEDVYRYSRSLPHDPSKDHLKTWFSLTLTNSASSFLCDNTGIGRIGEADAMSTCTPHIIGYCALDKMCIKKLTTFFSDSKELGSKANSFAQNSKRKLSGLEEAQKARGGRRMDTIYKGGEVEYGAVEIGNRADSTKELNDSRLKLPIVLKDMFLKIHDYAPELQNKIHIVGYNINGLSVQLMDFDSPHGYVGRIRRTKYTDYPTSKIEFTTRISTLIRLAALGENIIKETEASLANFDKALVSSKSLSKRTSRSSSTSTNQEPSSSSSP
ncbi:hypothetical protein INT45_010717 [Circinella minor]|uniref:Uncharacterized protein n=1 Tax=Circinella minor TaxID=1195481 RepID=A0A8H7RTQ7_9FUNG|nr:hypothetical protein INT45_010717 [Circinella minor]